MPGLAHSRKERQEGEDHPGMHRETRSQNMRERRQMEERSEGYERIVDYCCFPTFIFKKHECWSLHSDPQANIAKSSYPLNHLFSPLYRNFLKRRARVSTSRETASSGWAVSFMAPAKQYHREGGE